MQGLYRISDWLSLDLDINIIGIVITQNPYINTPLGLSTSIDREVFVRVLSMTSYLPMCPSVLVVLLGLPLIAP